MLINKTIGMVIALLLLGAGNAFAQFAAVVSPPRFELSVKPGGRVTEIVGITNTSAQQARYRMKTADWTFGADTSVTFSDTLAEGSCRPWVSIENKEIMAPPGRRVGFRVQVDVPPDAPPQECRFALLIEGDDQIVKNASGLSVPVAGRIGVIFYVSVDGAAPVLDISSAGVREVNGNRLPMLKVKNTGNAHGRLSAFLSGTDAKGQNLDFTPSTFPILPGETRVVELSATTRRGEVARVAYPVTISGQIEWGNQRTPFEQRFE